MQGSVSGFCWSALKRAWETTFEPLGYVWGSLCEPLGYVWIPLRGPMGFVWGSLCELLGYVWGSLCELLEGAGRDARGSECVVSWCWDGDGIKGIR